MAHQKVSIWFTFSDLEQVLPISSENAPVQSSGDRWMITGEIAGENAAGLWIGIEAIHDGEGKELPFQGLRDDKPEYFIPWRAISMARRFTGNQPEQVG